MQTSLSLPHTLALPASFTPLLSVITAFFFHALHSFSPSFYFYHLPPLNTTIILLLSYFSSSRFSIDPQSDPEALFRITPDTGLITTAAELDREREHWHNITVIATQRGQRSLFENHFNYDILSLSLSVNALF